jgi:hypothetical protein
MSCHVMSCHLLTSDEDGDVHLALTLRVVHFGHENEFVFQGVGVVVFVDDGPEKGAKGIPVDTVVGRYRWSS